MPFEFLLESGDEDDEDDVDARRERPPLVNRKTKSLPAFLQEQVVQDAAFINLMSGQTADLPERNSKTVRVFISSTFSDTHLERNVLMQRVYPKLKETCLVKHGLAFQIVDMRWGIQEGASLDQMAAEICLQEIKNCQRASVGPHFLAIISHRYGTKQLPYTVEQPVMQVLMTIMKQKGMTNELNLASKWYLLDENQMKPLFVLQPVLSTSEYSTDEVTEALAVWEKEEAILSFAMEKCAKTAQQTGDLREDKALYFFASVTHQELMHGVTWCRTDRREDALLFCRELSDIRDQVHTMYSVVSRFIDTNSDKSVDEETYSLLQQLKEQQLPTLLPSENAVTYRVSCRTVIGGSSTEQTEYEDRLAHDFEQQLHRLISRAVERLSKLESNSLYSEVLQHSQQCSNYVRQFQGRTDTMDEVKSYLGGDSRRPLVIHGISGCGKTSVMARAATLAREWLQESEQESAIVLVRFLGTSPLASNIRQTLRSLTQQMGVFLGSTDAAELLRNTEDFREIVDNFYKTAESLGQKQSRRVVMFLDSVDQLDSSDGAYTVGWLRPQLPANMKLVLSTLPDLFGILDSCRQLLGDVDSSESSSSFLEVRALQPELCCQIVRDMLAERGRCLTGPQWSVLRSAFTTCSLPIYMNLVFNQVVSWNSYTPVDSSSLDHSVRGAIELLFRRLERQHGKLLVSHALSYITASRSGLSEGEIEDLLSLDEDVLGEVFAHHLPPFIRLPPLCWTRVRHEIGPYLAEREADETRVLFWYHRQFWEVAQEIFFSDGDHIRDTHSRLADYFLGVWSGRPKPFQCPANLAVKLARQGTPPPTEADRQVASQPHVLQRNTDGSVRFNLRKLSELPFHLVRSGRIDEFQQHITFSMDFLEAKLNATSHHELLRDLQLFFDLDESSRGGGAADNADAERVFSALRVAGPSLNHSPLALSVDLCGRLRPFAEKSSRIRRLLSDCRNRPESACILPLNACLDSGSSFTHCSVPGQLSLGRLCENGNFYTIPVSENIVTWYDMDGNIVKTVTCDFLPGLSVGSLSILPRSGCFLSIEGNQLTHIFKLYRANLLSGSWRPIANDMSDVLPKKFYDDNDCFVATSENHILLQSTAAMPKMCHVVCLKAAPLKFVHLVTRKSNRPVLSKDNFVFYIGAVVPPSWSSSSESPPLKPRVLLLDSFQEFDLPCPEFESGQVLHIKAFVQDNDILLVTTSKHELESCITFTIHRFVVDGDSVREDVMREVQSVHDPGDKFNVAMSLNRSTAAICYTTCVTGGMGFLCKLPECSLSQLAYHPILQKSLVNVQGFNAEVPNSFDLHLSHDGSVLLSKTGCQFMFNIWSGHDGSFLTAIPDSAMFYCLGQPVGTDFFLICSVPQKAIGATVSLTKVLKLSMLAAYDIKSQGERITEQQLTHAMFHYHPETDCFTAAFFDSDFGGSAWEMDLKTGKRCTILEQKIEPSDHNSSGTDESNVDNEQRFLESLKGVRKDLTLYSDLMEFDLAVSREPKSLQVTIKDARNAVDSDKSREAVLFEVQLQSEDFQQNGRVTSGAEVTRILRSEVSHDELVVKISNHPSLLPFPANYLATSEVPGMFSHSTSVCGVLHKALGLLHLLINAESAPTEGDTQQEVTSDQGQSNINGRPAKMEVALLSIVDLRSRVVSKYMTLPSLQIGRDFMKYTGRQVALETLKQSACNFMMIVSKMGIFIPQESLGTEQDIGIDVSKQLFNRSLEFIQKKTSEVCSSDSTDYSQDTEILQTELKNYLRQNCIVNVPGLMEMLIAMPMLQQLSIDAIVNTIFSSNEMKFLSLKYNLKLSAADSCKPVMILDRPLHPHHVVVQYLCESVSSYSDALNKECMCWPGQLVVCDTNTMQVVSVSKTFDAGVLYLLSDGVHCITYRLKVFNIVSGDLVRDMDPTDSVVLIDMVCTPDRRLVIGQQHEKYAIMQLIGSVLRNNVGSASEEAVDFFDVSSARGSKTVQAYSTSDGSLVFNYRFEAEPFAMLVPSSDRMLLLLKDHPVQLYEILSGSAQSVESPGSGEAQPTQLARSDHASLMSTALQTDYLSYLRKALGKGLAQVADLRPSDPIEFLAQWLLHFAEAQRQ